MTYHSPFGALIANCAGQSLKYDGTLDEVLSEVATLSSAQAASTENAAKVWALHPPRVIRAVIDYKIQHPGIPKIEILLREAIRVALGIYSNPTLSAEAVDKLRSTIKTMGLEALLASPLHQPGDEVTWNATHPAKSQATAQQLAAQMQSQDVLFIALAHGGVAAGMDVYLRYVDNSGSQDSAFCVVRLSTQKLSDKEPRLSAKEIEYLKELARGRQVVVFDEDKSSGRTLDIAYNYFSTQVFPNQDVMTLSNLDLGGALIKCGFKEELVKIGKLIDPYDKHSEMIKLYKEKIIKSDMYSTEILMRNKLFKSYFSNLETPTKITSKEMYARLAYSLPDGDSEFLPPLRPKKKDAKLGFDFIDAKKPSYAGNKKPFPYSISGW